MGPGFESLKLHQWPIGQVVKTAASHAVNIGSNPVWVTIFPLDKWFDWCYNSHVVRSQAAFDIYKMGQSSSIRVRVDCHEGPPVPIPNTEVKLMCADNTWRATAWEDR